MRHIQPHCIAENEVFECQPRGKLEADETESDRWLCFDLYQVAEKLDRPFSLRTSTTAEEPLSQKNQAMATRSYIQIRTTHHPAKLSPFIYKGLW